MATPPTGAVNLADTPPVPPDVAGQTGGPMAGLAEMTAKNANQGGPPANLEASPTDPNGVLREGVETIRRILEDMAKVNPRVSAVSDRILSLLRSEINNVIAQGASPTQGSTGGGQRPAGSAAFKEGAPFPG